MNIKNNLNDSILGRIEHVRNLFKYVSVDEQAIESHLPNLLSLEYSYWDHPLVFKDGTDKSVNYLALFSTLSFRYWGEPKWHRLHNGQEQGGSYSLMMCLKEMIESGIDISDAKVMRELPFETFKSSLAGDNNTQIPYLEARYEMMQELGKVLGMKYEGKFTNLFEDVGYDATLIIQRLFNDFICYKDAFYYKGKEILFLKKAQEVAYLVYEQFRGKGLGRIKNMESLTGSSDYRLPQVLGHMGILKFSPELKAKLDATEILEEDSEMALEIRMSTIYACSLICQAAKDAGRDLAQYQISNMLWTAAQGDDSDMIAYPRIESLFV